MNYIVTGPICSGKSSFLNIAKKLGFNILKSDDIVTSLYEDKDIISKLTDAFKENKFYNAPKDISRQLFFESESNRIEIENIFHPRVHKVIQNKLESNNNICIEVPPLKSNTNLIENNNSIYIDSTKNIRRERFKERDNIHDVNIFNKMNEYQSDCLLIKSYCDIIIKNEDNENIFNEYFAKDIIKS